MLKKLSHADITWIDIENPNREEIAKLSDEYGLHPLVTEELMIPTFHPKVDAYGDYLYLVLHFPIISHKPGDETSHEVNFIIGKDYLITVRNGVGEGFHEFKKNFEVQSMLERIDLGEHSGYLFFYMMRALYIHTEKDLDLINESLKKIKRRVFEGEEGRMVMAISDLNRKLIDITQATRYHYEVLKSLEEVGRDFFGKEFGYYLRSITTEYTKLKGMLAGHRHILRELRETNDSLLATKTNSIMKSLTLIAFTTLPITLASGIFGMNTGQNFLQGPYTFWITLGILVVIGLSMYFYFKRRGWL